VVEGLEPADSVSPPRGSSFTTSKNPEDNLIRVSPRVPLLTTPRLPYSPSLDKIPSPKK